MYTMTLISNKRSLTCSVFEDGRLTTECEAPGVEINAVHYERGVLMVNDFLVGVFSPCCELHLCLCLYILPGEVKTKVFKPQQFFKQEIKEEEKEIKIRITR